MVLHFRQLEGPAEYWHELASNNNNSSTKIIWFYGTLLAETGQSWCGDCVRADRVIPNVFVNQLPDGVAVFKCAVGTREEWKQKPNPYKLEQQPGFNIQKIPTVALFSNGAEVCRLVEDECVDAKKIVEFCLQHNKLYNMK